MTQTPSVHQIEGPRDRERIRTVIVPEYEELSALIADRIVDVIQRHVAAKDHCVLGLATGSTPLGIYRELVTRCQRGEVSFANVITFNLDEYYPMPRESAQSYHRYMWETLFGLVDIDPANVHLPDGELPREALAEHCAAYERAIQQAGGIDFQILGIGRTGHIGFNEPGSGRDSRTRVVTLDTATRRDAASEFFGEQNVPREAITMGVATILEAREIALIATGEHKARIVQRAVEGEVSHDVAATFLQTHPNATVYLDQAAAAELTRVKTPWVLGPVEWTPEKTERAVVWLAETVEKALLKLSARDYVDHHLSSLLTLYGSPGRLNGQVFNRLRDKIRGRAKLMTGARVLVFSPHPDDDVISMGGILRKLVENRNDVVVAYMTSGNIAVFDDDIRRHLDFIVRSVDTLGLSPERVSRARETIETELEAKRPGDIDSPMLQELKRLIRESEALAALRHVGLTPSAARFLDLPFYRTGQIRKKPACAEDIAIVRAVLKEVSPEHVFMAGDLSDPHGTHRVCKAVIESALAGYGPAQPQRWLYRGAWEEWSLTEADVLVPLSHEELQAKIHAIFKHESQKDRAPFPGAFDEREFWQRVDERNRGTAARADRLGLAEYYAMEAYVVQQLAVT